MRARAFLSVALAIIFLNGGAAEARTHHHHHHRSARTMSVATTACGGTERWDVKDGSDTGAPNVHMAAVNGITIADLNLLSPQPLDPDGRMQEEKVIYRITGILRLFKHETDNDYHIVITDDAAAPYSTGHSMVVEVPDPSCVAGAHGQYGPSLFLAQLQESRSDFEQATHNLPRNTDLAARNIPITLVGILFFDFMHGQTGHGLPHPSQDADPRQKVVELHPVLCNDVGGYREQAGKPVC